MPYSIINFVIIYLFIFYSCLDPGSETNNSGSVSWKKFRIQLDPDSQHFMTVHKLCQVFCKLSTVNLCKIVFKELYNTQAVSDEYLRLFVSGESSSGIWTLR